MSIKVRGKCALALGAAIVAACCSAVLLKAENGRNFAGTYRVHDVVDHGSIVKFDLHAKIFNYSGGDVNDATITVADRERVSPPAEAANFSGEISGVSIPYRKSVEVDGTFTVPAPEFEQIRRGVPPNVIVSYANEEGKSVHDAVQLRPEVIARVGAR